MSVALDTSSPYRARSRLARAVRAAIDLEAIGEFVELVARSEEQEALRVRRDLAFSGGWAAPLSLSSRLGPGSVHSGIDEGEDEEIRIPVSSPTRGRR
jgi:hypothetical protein